MILRVLTMTEGWLWPRFLTALLAIFGAYPAALTAGERIVNAKPAVGYWE